MYPVYKTHLAKIEGAIVWPYSMFYSNYKDLDIHSFIHALIHQPVKMRLKPKAGWRLQFYCIW